MSQCDDTKGDGFFQDGGDGNESAHWAEYEVDQEVNSEVKGPAPVHASTPENNTRDNPLR